MKMKKPLLLILIILLPVTMIAQSGKVFDDLSMSSKILKMERKYALYLPPDYEHSTRSYPVLYLLHGAGDDQSGWVQFGEVKHIADKAIKESKATPMIIVMPDAKAGRLGYFNDIKGEWRYEDFFFEEFMPYIEQKYRIRAEKEFRAVAGLSMGGGGSFMYALHHPELFSSACPLSAYVGPLSIEDAQQAARWAQAEYDTQEELEKWYHQHNALSLIERVPEDQLKAVRWYIDCGDDDFLFEGNSLVHIAMKKKGMPHEYRIRDGGHSWEYWRTALPEVLEFVSGSFNR
jgi:enterochelin esterase-like enzyme